MRSAFWMYTSLMFAVLATLLPVPLPYQAWIPQWACLITLFWVLNKPNAIGLLAIFLVGLALDVFQATLLGAHAMSLVLIASCAYAIRYRFAFYTLWQQTILIGVFSLLYLNILYWLHYFIMSSTTSWNQWVSVLSTSLCWPILVISSHKLFKKAFQPV